MKNKVQGHILLEDQSEVGGKSFRFFLFMRVCMRAVWM